MCFYLSHDQIRESRREESKSRRAAAPAHPTAASIGSSAGGRGRMQHPGLQPQHLPRRVIIHLDLDCFYCQVEQKRCSIPRDTPVAVQQWNGLIAINYAARAAGITRHMRVQEAKKLLPSLVLCHVKTIGNINDHQQQPQQQQQQPKAAGSEPPPPPPADGAAASPSAASASASAAGGGADGSALDRGSAKACLNRYRRASAEIMALLARLAPGCPLEKASIDEAYLDITAAVARELAAAEAGAGGEAGGDDAGGLAGLMAAAAAGSVVLGDGGLQPDREWDRLAAAGAVVAGRLRRQLLEQLDFTASAGIASNKLLAKIASAANKPNQQTLVLPRAVPELMQGLPLGKVKGLGGKLGSRLQELGAATAGAAAGLSWEQLVAAFDSKALWLYNRVRGVDDEPVTPRSLTQSLTSCKSFPGTRSPAVVRQWCGVLAEELADRLEEDALDHGRTPRSLVVQYRGGDAMGSRDGGKSVRGAMPHHNPRSSPSADAISAAAFALFSRVAAPWPLNRLAISATDFAATGGSSGAAMARFLAASSQQQKQRKEQQQQEQQQQQQQEEAAAQPSTAVTQQQHPSSSSSRKNKASQPTLMQLFLQPMQQKQQLQQQQQSPPPSRLPQQQQQQSPPLLPLQQQQQQQSPPLSPLQQQQQQQSPPLLPQQQSPPLSLPQQQQQQQQWQANAGKTAEPSLAAAAAASAVEALAAAPAAGLAGASAAADLSDELAGVDVAEQARLLRDIEIRRLQERGAKRKQAASSSSSKAGKKGRAAAKPTAGDGKQLSITSLLSKKG